MSFRLPPSEYTGELLCGCCGEGQTTGNFFLICADPGPQTHAESCAIYNYGDGFVCDRCEQWLDRERASNKASTA